MGCRKIIFVSIRTATKDMRARIEDRWELILKKNYQITCTRFLAKYEGLYLYYVGFEKRYSIENEFINFVKGDGYDLTFNQDHSDGTSTDHEYFALMMTCSTES